MKKTSRTVAALMAISNATAARKERTMRKLQNALSEEAKAEAQAVIDECQSQIDAIKAAIEELSADETNHDEELKARIEELKKRQEEIENKMKAPRSFMQVANYLENASACTDFMRVVKNSASKSEFVENWKGNLVKNGITPTSLMLPAAVVSEIADQWEKNSGEFLRLLDITGLKVWKGAINTADQDAETARAKGHTAGKAKGEESLTFSTVEIRAQYVYKYITIDREILDQDDESGVLARYIAREMVEQLNYELMRAVLIGDGRAANSDYKITKFEAITSTAAITAGKTTAVDLAAAVPTRAEVRHAIAANIKGNGDRVAVMSDATFSALAEYTLANGGTPMWNTKEELAAQLGVRDIVLTDLLDADSTADVKAPKVIVFVGRAYKVVGGLTVEGYENFVLSYNKKEFLSEVYAGGALAYPKSAVVLNAPLSK